MTLQYFAKVTNMQDVQVAIAKNEAQAKSLKQQQYEPCSRAFYESAQRNQATTTSK